MSRCCCGFLLGILVIVFAWWNVSWAPIALTILGAVIAVKATAGICCCEMICKDKDKEQAEEEARQEPAESED